MWSHFALHGDVTTGAASDVTPRRFRMSAQPSKSKKKNTLVDFIAKKRDTVYAPTHVYTKDEALSCLAKILVEAYLNTKRHEQAKQL